MKPRVVFLLQVTALCGIFTYDFSKGYDDGRNYMDSIWTSFVVLLGGTMASGAKVITQIHYWKQQPILLQGE